ncbi:MAG: hypothetical protein AABZ55_11745 [Bdellovibrionota bacterium]
MNFIQRILAPKILERGPDLNRVRNICIGTNTESLTEALYLSPIPAALKSRFPNLHVQTYTGQMNPIVFTGNPNVEAMASLPKVIYGKRVAKSIAHPIQSLEQGLGLQVDTIAAPELYLSEHEKEWARGFLKSKRLPTSGDKPLCIIHPWRKKHRRTEQILAVEVWDSIALELARRYRVWQVGMWDQPALKGCEYYFLSSGTRWEARDMFSIMTHAQVFVGLASAPMHVAKALKIPSIILVGNDPDAGLYKDGYAISVNGQSSQDILAELRAGLGRKI